MKDRKQLIKILFCLLAAAVLFSGCEGFSLSYLNGKNSTENQKIIVNEETKEKETTDFAIFMSVDTEAKTVDLQSILTGKEVQLKYTGASDIQNKYGDIMAISQLKQGEIVDLAYTRSDKKIRSMKISESAWEYSGVKNLKIDVANSIMTVANEKYQYTPGIPVISNGELGSIIDINEKDELILRGYNKKVCSVVIDKGHGYVRLEDYDYFVGGWLEIGQEVIRTIEKDMLLVVPEGNYNLTVANHGTGGTKKIVVKRDEELAVNVGDLKEEELPIGSIRFNINPKTAELEIDGKKTAYNELVSLEYGPHKIQITADGYKSHSETIKVGETLKTLEIELESEEEETDTNKDPAADNKQTQTPAPNADTQTGTQNNTNTNTNTNSSTNNSDNTGNKKNEGATSAAGKEEDDDDSDDDDNKGYKIYVDAPAGAEVYFDGNYIGIAPLSFTKRTGSHTFSLRKSGYATRSYTVYIYNKDEDCRYSFSELEKAD